MATIIGLYIENKKNYIRFIEKYTTRKSSIHSILEYIQFDNLMLILIES